MEEGVKKEILEEEIVVPEEGGQERVVVDGGMEEID